MSERTVYVVCQVRSFNPEGFAADWEIQGVFDSRDIAVQACVEACDCIMPVPLNAILPRETVRPPGIEYPLSHTPELPGTKLEG